MKKFLFYLLIFIGLAIVCTYIIIPNSVEIKANTMIGVAQPALYRILLNKENRSRWWPGKIQITKDGRAFNFNGYDYTIYKNDISVLPITLTNDKNLFRSEMYFFSLDERSLQVKWVAKVSTSYNLVQRVQLYFEAKKIEKDFTVILEKMKMHFAKAENVYGVPVSVELIKDSQLINTAIESSIFPSTSVIYAMINKLEFYAHENKATVTGYPMLNITKNNDSSYIVRTALPIDKPLKNTKDIVFKRMPENTNILTAEVKGGYYTTEKALEEIIQYAYDFKKNIPGLPFYSLITDRSKEADTTKWITKVYCPVM